MPTWQIPIPVSANRLWRSGRTRKGKHVTYRDKAYLDWLTEAGLVLKMAGAKLVSGPVRIEIVIHGGSGVRANSDADNRIKPCLDLLCHAGVIEGDTVEVVQQIGLTYHPPAGRKAVAVFVVSVETIPEEN